jgi:hypothetical protein
LGSQLRLTGVQLLDAAKEKGVISDYVVLDDEMLKGKGGHYDGSTGIVCLSRSVFSGSNSDNARYLFTVDHEVSHALLGHKTLRNRRHVKTLVEKAVPSIAAEERQAERLAVAVLSPFHLAEFSLGTTAPEIARRFGLRQRASEILAAAPRMGNPGRGVAQAAAARSSTLIASVAFAENT